MRRPGVVYLVGAGPGDPGLLTVRGRALLERAEVVIADYLVDARLLGHAPATAEVVVRQPRRGGLDQEEINRLLVAHAQAGKRVVRLKGGDPFVFGRGGEEAEVLRAAGIPYEVVPGVTAAVAAPAYAGIPVTHRGLSGAVAFVTGHEADRKDGGEIDWAALARGAGTLILYMSVTRLADVAARLVAAGRSPDEPVAVVERGTLPEQRTVLGTLGDIAERVREAGLRPPALTVVGPVVELRERLAWFEARPAPRRVLVLSTRAPGVDLRGDVEVVHASPLVVVPRFAAVKEALAALERPRTIALASVHAVDALVGALRAAGGDARDLAGIKLAAVGRATAARLSALSLEADLVGEAGGRALAGEIAAAGFAGPVLVLGAAGGRPELGDALAAAGLAVVRVEAYETLPDEPALAALAAAHRAQPFAAVGFASPKGAAAFLAALGGPQALDGAAVGAIGETTRDALAAAGLRDVRLAPTPDLEALTDALVAAVDLG